MTQVPPCKAKKAHAVYTQFRLCRCGYKIHMKYSKIVDASEVIIIIETLKELPLQLLNDSALICTGLQG